MSLKPDYMHYINRKKNSCMSKPTKHRNVDSGLERREVQDLCAESSWSNVKDTTLSSVRSKQDHSSQKYIKYDSKDARLLTMSGGKDLSSDDSDCRQDITVVTESESQKKDHHKTTSRKRKHDEDNTDVRQEGDVCTEDYYSRRPKHKKHKKKSAVVKERDKSEHKQRKMNRESISQELEKRKVDKESCSEDSLPSGGDTGGRQSSSKHKRSHKHKKTKHKKEYSKRHGNKQRHRRHRGSKVKHNKEGKHKFDRSRSKVKEGKRKENCVYDVKETNGNVKGRNQEIKSFRHNTGDHGLFVGAKYKRDKKETRGDMQSDRYNDLNKNQKKGTVITKLNNPETEIKTLKLKKLSADSSESYVMDTKLYLSESKQQRSSPEYRENDSKNTKSLTMREVKNKFFDVSDCRQDITVVPIREIESQKEDHHKTSRKRKHDKGNSGVGQEGDIYSEHYDIHRPKHKKESILFKKNTSEHKKRKLDRKSSSDDFKQRKDVTDSKSNDCKQRIGDRGNNGDGYKQRKFKGDRKSSRADYKQKKGDRESSPGGYKLKKGDIENISDGYKQRKSDRESSSHGYKIRKGDKESCSDDCNQTKGDREDNIDGYKQRKDDRESNHDGYKQRKGDRESSSDGYRKRKGDEESSSDDCKQTKGERESSSGGYKKKKGDKESNNDDCKQTIGDRESNRDGNKQRKGDRENSSNGFRKRKGDRESSSDNKQRKGDRESSNDCQQRKGDREISDDCKQRKGDREISDDNEQRKGDRENKNSDDCKQKEGNRESNDDCKQTKGDRESSSDNKQRKGYRECKNSDDCKQTKGEGESSDDNKQRKGDRESSDDYKQRKGDRESSDDNKQRKGDRESSDDCKQTKNDVESSDDCKQTKGDRESSDDNKQRKGDRESSDDNKQRKGDRESSDDNKQRKGDRESSDDCKQTKNDVESSDDCKQTKGDGESSDDCKQTKGDGESKNSDVCKQTKGDKESSSDDCKQTKGDIESNRDVCKQTKGDRESSTGGYKREKVIHLPSGCDTGGRQLDLKKWKSYKHQKETREDLKSERYSNLDKNQKKRKVLVKFDNLKTEMKNLKLEDPSIVYASLAKPNDLHRKEENDAKVMSCSYNTKKTLLQFPTDTEEEKEIREINQFYDEDSDWGSSYDNNPPKQVSSTPCLNKYRQSVSQKQNESSPSFTQNSSKTQKKISPIMWTYLPASSWKGSSWGSTVVSDLTGTKVANIRKKELMKIGIPDLITWLKCPDNIYIGRNMAFYVPGATTNKWGNPFSVKKYGRDGCIRKYEDHIRNTPALYNSLEELTGKCLGCWCHPEPCHGHVLVKLLNEKLHMKS